MESLQSLGVVEVGRADLELFRAAFNSAFHYSTVVDLEEQYRKLTQRPQSSNLTKSLENALTLVSAYIEEANAKESNEDTEAGS